MDVTGDAPEPPDAVGPPEGAAAPPDCVPCPNCCRLALVVSRSMGLLFYRCELCLSVGAVPAPGAPDPR